MLNAFLVSSEMIYDFSSLFLLVWIILIDVLMLNQPTFLWLKSTWSFLCIVLNSICWYFIKILASTLMKDFSPFLFFFLFSFLPPAPVHFFFLCYLCLPLISVLQCFINELESFPSSFLKESVQDLFYFLLKYLLEITSEASKA